MAQYMQMRPFMRVLFDDERTADKAAEIGPAMLAARSIRLTEVAAQLRGSSDASYKRIQRFLRQADPRQVLWRLFQEQAEFVIGDRPRSSVRKRTGPSMWGRSKMASPKGSGPCCWQCPIAGGPSRVDWSPIHRKPSPWARIRAI